MKKHLISRVMSSIRSKDTKPELIVRKVLHLSGYRYRLHKKTLPGRPDIFIRKINTAIFINGCFWHQHSGCSLAKQPKSNKLYWLPKLKRNVLRDKKNIDELKKRGLRVITLWECALKSQKTGPKLLARLKIK